MSGCPFASRRGFLAASGGLLAAAGVGRTARAQQADATAVQAEPFWGAHQAGIATPQQHSTYFAALDLTAKKPPTSSRCCAAGPPPPPA
jgi:deferrochelatase/peroxidase EfeB